MKMMFQPLEREITVCDFCPEPGPDGYHRFVRKCGGCGKDICGDEHSTTYNIGQSNIGLSKSDLHVQIEDLCPECEKSPPPDTEEFIGKLRQVQKLLMEIATHQAKRDQSETSRRGLRGIFE